MEDIPLTLEAAQTVMHGRQAAEAIIRGDDDRLLVICGPCSVHDIKAALEYGEPASSIRPHPHLMEERAASLLKEYADEASEDLQILMRCAASRHIEGGL